MGVETLHEHGFTDRFAGGGRVMVFLIKIDKYLNEKLSLYLISGGLM
jgi:hypothetical protein